MRGHWVRVLAGFGGIAGAAAACSGNEFTAKEGHGSGAVAGARPTGGGDGGGGGTGGSTAGRSSGGGSAGTAATGGGGNDGPGGAGAPDGDGGDGGDETGGSSGGGTGGAGGGTSCPEGSFPCGGSCEPNAGCTAGEGSCQNNGVRLCTTGGVVDCSVRAKAPICTPLTPNACDPCGSGSSLSGSALCDAYGCAFGSCTPASGGVFDQYAPAWNHACGAAHDMSGQNWLCDSVPSREHACVCAERGARLPPGSYRLRVTAGFPPTSTPMVVRVLSGATSIANQTFEVSDLDFKTYELGFALASCADVTFRIERVASAVEFVINRVTLDRI